RRPAGRDSERGSGTGSGAVGTISPPYYPPPDSEESLPAYFVPGAAVMRLYPELYVPYHSNYQGYLQDYPYWQRLELTLLLLAEGLELPEEVRTLLQTMVQDDARLSVMLDEHDLLGSSH